MSLTSDLAPHGLRRWPEEAFEYEPAHGFFVRLAKRNGALSTRVFAESMGLNGRNLDLQELVSFCREFRSRHVERLITATPTFEGPFVYLNGQKFRKLTDWSLSQPRACGECLGESRHHRNWWDIAVIDECPIHHRTLQRGVGSQKLAWWHPEIGITPDGHDLSMARSNQISSPRISWDAYVLGRMGVTQHFSVPSLDESEMFEVIAAVELLGRATIFGFATRAPRGFRILEEQRHAALKIGFSAFRAGVEGLEALLRAYLASSNFKKSDVLSPKSFFGWLHYAAKSLPRSPAQKEVTNAIANIAFSVGLSTRGRPRQLRRPETLKTAAYQLGMSKRRLRTIALKCGLISECAPGEYHSLSDDALKALREIIGDLISVKDALGLTGFSYEKFRKVCTLKGVVPFLNEGSGHAKYRRSEILALTAGSESNKVAKESKPRSHPKRNGLRGGEAGAILGIFSDVRTLIDAGYLKPVPSEGGRRSDLVDAASVESFRSRYMRASMYAGALKCAPVNAFRHLRTLGVERLAVPTNVSFVERETVRELLGLSVDPDDERVFPGFSFWTAMRTYLQKRGSATLIYPGQDGDSATLRTGTLRFAALVRLGQVHQQIVFEFKCGFGRQPRRTEALVTNLKSIRDAWPTATVSEDGNFWALRDRRQGFSISAPEQWEAHFDWLEERMRLLRPFFNPGRQLPNSTVGVANADPAACLAA